MMLPLVVIYQRRVYSVSAATTASGVDNAASPTGRIAERDYFTSERLITMQKQLEGTQKYTMSSADNELPITMGNHAIIV